MSEEFLIRAAVSHIPWTVAVGIERGKRRGEDRVIDGLIRQALDDFHTVTVKQREVVANGLIDAVHD